MMNIRGQVFKFLKQNILFPSCQQETSRYLYGISQFQAYYDICTVHLFTD
jgi:hypothetical protein